VTDGDEDVVLTRERSRRQGGWMREQPARLVLAITFLTAVPLRLRRDVVPADLWGSMGWYPLVGFGLGMGAWALYAGSAALLPGLVAAALVVLVLEAVTRGLHMDGLMDTCDGYFSGAPPARALEIMKDSHAGAMGVIGAILVIVLKVAALGALSSSAAAAPLLAGWAAARFTPPLAVMLWPYARAAGTGEPFTRDRSPGIIALAAVCLLTAVAVAGLVAGVMGHGALWHGLVIAAVAVGVALLAQALVSKRLGGLTGDVYGMGIQLAETAALVTACALIT
jgi:adenosylcobinamide-GDP ribazoletransferase